MLTAVVAALLSLAPAPAPRPCTLSAVRAALARRDVALVPTLGPTLVLAPGLLARAECAAKAPAEIVQILSDPPIDFRERADLPDGRLVFGGTGGLVALDRATLATTRLTTAPVFVAPPPEGERRCWSAEPGHPVTGWDRAPRLRPGGRALTFERGGPCAYEGAPTRTTMVLDLASQVVRPARAASALVVARSGLVVIGDGADGAGAVGAGCDEAQARGAVWVSFWGGVFLPVVFAPGDAMGVVGLAEGGDGALYALTGICRSGAARGGNLYRAPPGTLAFEPLDVPSRGDDRGVDVGGGIVALAGLRGGELRVARAASKGRALVWQSSHDGATWKRASAPPPSRVPRALARALGVDRVSAVVDVRGTALAWALTDDGAFARGRGRADAWVRVFPGPRAP